jgi:hypothetical protein
MFTNTLPIHIASRHNTQEVASSYTQEEILNTLDKRPLTQEDIDLLFDSNTQAIFQQLLKANKVTRKRVGELEFFLPSQNIKRKRGKN